MKDTAVGVEKQEQVEETAVANVQLEGLAETVAAMHKVLE